MTSILKCESCNSYGLSDVCSCGSRRVTVKPAKFSPEDKYGRYRREYKKNVEDNNL
ncbi:RNA-protein complex protein Nop10 [Candidatus Woesearchaeota archaeon]|nr:RNA-protein complex protein Nop10 [Candidatus Woesearchaeota archaeon]MCF7901191.1 RNA-protein complex protein Nop10 [Candidatus Woesearchaeota archaeon]MCF8013714.1 RNA-protein complex protein Nop10 [Candidatus Woesearchaeota archaeon]